MKKKSIFYSINTNKFLKFSVLLVVFYSNFLTAQETDIDMPFSVVEYIPLFPDCVKLEEYEHLKCFNEKMNEHIISNFSIPIEAKEKGMKGRYRVNLMFVIKKDGTIGNIRARGPSKFFEKAAIEIIQKLPKMKPGMNEEGKVVNVPYSIPIIYKL